MLDQYSRTRLLLGAEAIKKLQKARVAVFGIGGVGGFVCEALARSGIGAFDLIDNDRVSLTNLNRQIIATHRTIGEYKTEVMRDRILEINPEAEVTVHTCFFLPETADQFDFSSYSYVVDAVDTVTAKIAVIMHAKEAGVPVISSMGAGNKLDPTQFHVADIYKTSMCPLAKVMRHEMRKRGVRDLKVVYSTEPPAFPVRQETEDSTVETETAETVETKGTDHRPVPGSTAWVPSVAGMIIGGEVIRDLAGV